MTFRDRLILTFVLLWIVAVALAVALVYYNLNRSLYARIEQTLLDDLQRLAEQYNSGKTGNVVLSTGETKVTLYISGQPGGETKHLIPDSYILQADSRGKLFTGSGYVAAYTLLERPAGAVLAVSQSTNYIQSLIGDLNRSLVQLLLFLLIPGVALLVFSLNLSLQPLRSATKSIQSRGPENLQPIPYSGPNDELRQTVDRVNTLLSAVREAQNRERAFLAEVSHELRTPLTSLNGYLSRLQRNPNDAQAIEVAQRTAGHLTRLVSDLLSLAKGEAERSVNAHLVNLNSVLKRAVEEYPGVLFLPNQVSVSMLDSTHPGEQRLEVLGDPDRLLQLGRNLIANAVRHAGSGASGVQVRSASQDGWAVFVVRDNGPGIEPDLLPKLFQRFARGPQGGTGLGLAIAKQITEAHKGEIKVVSQPGDTRFMVRIPLVKLEDEE
jgi:signal transduction histidine kinase